MKLIYYSLFLMIVLNNEWVFCKYKNVIDNIQDFKEFKKLLRTKTNVLVAFVKNAKQTAPVLKVFKETADNVKGEGTMAIIDCSNENARKVCKKLKIDPDPQILKHYKDGEFNKDYDRKYTVDSMINFMRDPTGDIPWEEDSMAVNITHLPDAQSLTNLLKKESRPVMVMFYAPWCGFCKTLKPEYVQAANELSDSVVMAAIDVNRPKNTIVRTRYNISGFPTLQYFKNGKLKYVYEGENNKKAIVSFMRNPKEQQEMIHKQKKVEDWSETDNDIVHLLSDNFDAILKDEQSALVMFYAPWCGHCKKMKPEYELAATEMKQKNIAGMLAAVDATKETQITQKFDVKGYPTLKYFQFGEFKFNLNLRDAKKIVEFMQNPSKEPPPPPKEDNEENIWGEKSEVVELDDDNFKGFLKKRKHVLVMFYAPWCGHCKKTKPEFNKAAEHFKDNSKYEFASVDCTKYQSLCGLYNVKGYPTIKYFNYLKIVKPYNGERQASDFIEFMENDGEVKVKDSWGDHPGSESVIRLNDNNFEILKSKSIALVMFYAPWCQHCSNMKPDYTKLANNLSKNSKILIGAMDCTVNSEISQQYKISGFPTVKLFKNGKFLKDYNGNREFNDLLEFVKTSSGLKKDEL